MENRIICEQDTELILNDGDFITVEIDSAGPLEVLLKTRDTSSSIMLINIHEHAGKVKLRTELAPASRLTVLYWNQAVALKVTEEVILAAGAVYKVAYGELEKGRLERRADYYLKGFQADVQVVSSAIVSENKRQELTSHHQAKQTSSMMKTYGVVTRDGSYYVKANGHIEKGASGSKAFQKSRVLTFADKQKTEILPMLLIDENDVEAAHAVSIGQLDEEQLYYLQSRGITKNAALQLIALGYLMPITQIIDDDKLRDRLVKIVNEKVQDTCLI